MIKIDNKKCIKCGLCEQECITKAIELDENNMPHFKNPSQCLNCQHCFMVCPNNAINCDNVTSNEVDIQKIASSEEVLNLIKSRRSIRKYKNENIKKETIEKLKSMLKYAPTGCNNHQLYFSIIDDVEVMNDFKNKINSKLIKFLNKRTIKFFTKKSKKFATFFRQLENGTDIIFRNAPHMIVVSAPISAPCPKEDGIIALSYFELYAKSLGLGTLWCGFAQAALKIMPEFCEYLKIPKNYFPVYCMLFGYSDITYLRNSIPTEYQFTTVEKQEIKLNIINKLKIQLKNFLR